MITEIVLYRTVPSVSESAHLAAATAAHDEVVALQPGIGRRSLYRVADQEALWVDYVEWESADHFQDAMQAVEDHPGVAEWMQQIDPGSVQMHLLEERLRR